MSDALTRHKTFTSVIKDVRARVLSFVISTGARDRDGDTIAPAGWNFAEYRKNAIILWQHDRQQLPVARCLDVHVANGEVLATAEFTPPEISQFGDTVYQMLKAGFLNAVSVGFKATKWAERPDGVDFQEQTLLEFSVVNLPALPDARVIGRANDDGRMKAWLDHRGGDEPFLEVADEQPTVEVTDELFELAMRARHRPAMNAAALAGLTEPSFDIDRGAVEAALREVVPRLLRDHIREEVARGLRMARGRVD